MKPKIVFPEESHRIKRNAEPDSLLNLTPRDCCMDNRKSGAVNLRPREFYVAMAKARIHKPVPIKQCCICLRKIGFGYTFISRVTSKDKAVVKKFTKRIQGQVVRRSAAMTGRARKCARTFNAVELIMFEYGRETKRLNSHNNFWKRHPAVNNREKTKRLAWRLKNDPAYRLKFYARKRVKNAIGKGGMKPCRSISKIIGCTGAFLAEHLSSKFRDGMTLENHGTVWHIDHITALSRFNLSDPHQLSIASHWTNLQPLLCHENLTKGNR